MKLTDREIEMLRNISGDRRRRKIGAWLGLATALVIFIGALYFDFAWEALGSIAGLFLGMATAMLSSEYFGVRTEDKLIDLLWRYVNSDPDAISQLSSRPTSRGFAAQKQ